MDNDIWLWLYTIEKNYNANIEDMSGPALDRLLELGWAEPSKHGTLNLTKKGTEALKAVPSNTVYVEYSESHEVTRDAVDDGWDNGDADLHGTFESAGLSKPASYLWESHQTNAKAGDTVLVVWCQYGTGSTFGHSAGHFGFEGVARTQAGANMLKKLAAKTHDDYFGGLESTSTEEIVL